ERAERVKLDDGERAVGERQREHHDAEVAAIVEQREKASIETRQRTDAQDDVQQRKSRRAERSDQQRLDRQLGTKRRLRAKKRRDKGADQTRGRQIIAALLGVPGDGAVTGAHRNLAGCCRSRIDGGNALTRARGAGCVSASAPATASTRSSPG